MNLILVDDADVLASGHLRLRGRRAEHIARVIRPDVGQRLRVGWVRGGVATAATVQVSAEQVELGDFDLEELRRPISPPPTSVVVAIPRPKAVGRAVQDCASFGVARIDLTNAWRVEKSYLDSPRLQPAPLAEAARLGLEQGGGTWLPDIEVHRLFVPFVSGLAGRSGTRVFCDPGAETGLEDVDCAGTVTLAIGPEGGWIDTERRSLCEAGFSPVSLGTPILRSEVAATAALSQLALIRRSQNACA